MEIISVFYEQEIMAQHINYYIIESEYIYEADNKVSLKERASNLIKKVLAAIKKFFTETLPNAYMYITTKLSKLSPFKRTTVNPNAIVDNYKKIADLYNLYGNEIIEKDKEIKEMIANSSSVEFIPSNNLSDIMKEKKILTVEDLDAQPKNNHSAQELIYAITKINKIRKTDISKLEKDLNRFFDNTNKIGSTDNKLEVVYFKMVSHFSSIISQITSLLNANLRLLIRDTNGFKNCLYILH